jgi:hypothetical protein
MAKRKTRLTEVTEDQNKRIAYTVIELDHFRDRLARLLLALLGLRHVLFISAKEPIQIVDVEPAPAPKKRKKSTPKKAV